MADEKVLDLYQCGVTFPSSAWLHDARLTDA